METCGCTRDKRSGTKLPSNPQWTRVSVYVSVYCVRFKIHGGKLQENRVSKLIAIHCLGGKFASRRTMALGAGKLLEDSVYFLRDLRAHSCSGARE